MKRYAVHDYVRTRAEVEGVAYGLRRGFYKAAMRRGVRQVFGVVVNDRGTPTSDAQEPGPGFLRRWLLAAEGQA